MIKLIDLEVYKLAIEIGDKVWEIVDKWDMFRQAQHDNYCLPEHVEGLIRIRLENNL